MLYFALFDEKREREKEGKLEEKTERKEKRKEKKKKRKEKGNERKLVTFPDALTQTNTKTASLDRNKSFLIMYGYRKPCSSEVAMKNQKVCM